MRKYLLGVSILPALLVMPAMADAPNTTDVTSLFGDVVISGQSIRNAAFGGRRMSHTEGGKYQNMFPKYKMEGRSLSIDNSTVYVGPVTLTLRTLTDEDKLIYNYQINDVDIDLADAEHANVTWTDFNLPVDSQSGEVIPASQIDWTDPATVSQITIFNKVFGAIGANAYWTAPGVWNFANRDNSTVAGTLSFNNTTATVDGATINTSGDVIMNDSTVTFANNLLNDDSHGLDNSGWYTNAGDISSNGITTIHADNISVDNSRFVVSAGASLVLNPETMATFQNTSGSDNGGAIYNDAAHTGWDNDLQQYLYEKIGSVTISGASVFDNNSVAERGGAIYNQGTMDIEGATFTRNKSTSNSWLSAGGAVYNAGDAEYTSVHGVLTISDSVFGDANDVSKANIAVFGGAIANDSNNAEYAELTLNGVNFYNNKAVSEADGGDSALGGAIYNNGIVNTTQNITFMGNSAAGYAAEGGAIYTTNEMTFGSSTDTEGVISFVSNTVTDTDGGNGGLGGAISNTGNMTFWNKAVFTENKALLGDADNVHNRPMGGAVFNDGTMEFKNGADFTGNEAMYGGAIGQLDPFGATKTIIVTDGSFKNNVAGNEGGAIFQYGIGTVTTINAKNTNVVFSGNTANGNPNDIMNYRGTINLNAADGKTVTLNGGIDGLSGSWLNINGADDMTGTVSIANELKNHSVNLSKGTLNFANETEVTNSRIDLTNGTSLTANNVTFTGSSSAEKGAAIYNYGGTLTLNGTTNFTQNTSTNYGGAILNQGVINAQNIVLTGNNGSEGGSILNLDRFNVSGTSTFTGNEATGYGGAIQNEGAMTFTGAVTFGGTGDTDKNIALHGGAIYNNHGGGSGLAQATITFKDVVTFENNVASVQGGAISNGDGDTMIFEKLATFKGNKAQQNGNAIFTTGTMIFKNGLVLQDNGSDRTGHGSGNSGISTSGKGLVSVYGGDIVVTGNTAGAGAGFNGKVLLGAYENGTQATGTDAVENIVFRNNAAVGDSTGDLGTAGALYAGNGTKLYAKNITFDNNSNSNLNGNWAYGGAIAIQGGTLDIIGSAKNEFINNHSYATHDIEESKVKFGGGAIQVRGNTGDTTLTVGTATSTNNFAGNTSAMHGGAIHVRAESASNSAKVYINGTTNFSGNSAALNGGAISNSPVLGTSVFDLNGNTTFTGNSAEGFGGAVYNTGTLSFNGDSVFADNTDSTGANDIYNNGSVTFNGDTIIGSGIVGGGDLTVGRSVTLSLGDGAAISQDTITLNGKMIATLNEADTARFTATTFGGDGELALTIKSAGTYHVFGGDVFGNVTNSVYDMAWVGGDLTASVKSAADIAADSGVSQTAASSLSTLAGSSDENLQAAAVIVQEALARGDTAYIEREAEKTAPAEKPVAQSVATAVQGQVISLAGDRMAMATPAGRNGGDIEADFGVWGQGLINKSRYAGHFDGNTKGLALGADAALDHKYIVGLGYAYNTSDINAKNGGQTDIDTHSVFVYGQYKPAEWFVNATLNYSISQYQEHIKQFGGLVKVGSEYDVQTFGGQITAGYDFNPGITPEIGLRYMHMSQDDYERSVYNMRISGSESDFLTGVLGLKYKFQIESESDWKWSPEMRGAIKYDMISDKLESTIAMPGIASYTVRGDRLSRMGSEFGMGLTVEHKGLEMSLLYDIDIRDDYTSQTGMFKIRYDF